VECGRESNLAYRQRSNENLRGFPLRRPKPSTRRNWRGLAYSFARLLSGASFGVRQVRALLPSARRRSARKAQMKTQKLPVRPARLPALRSTVPAQEVEPLNLTFARPCGRTLLILLLLNLAALSAPGPAAAQQLGDFTYTNTGNGIATTGYKGVGGAVTIPSSIAGLSVTSIGEGAFGSSSPSTNLTSVAIPNGVTSIGAAAFGWCISLTAFTNQAALPA